MWIYCFCLELSTAYEMRISDGSSDLCSSDLPCPLAEPGTWLADRRLASPLARLRKRSDRGNEPSAVAAERRGDRPSRQRARLVAAGGRRQPEARPRGPLRPCLRRARGRSATPPRLRPTHGL